jgi:hypothetical protein
LNQSLWIFDLKSTKFNSHLTGAEWHTVEKTRRAKTQIMRLNGGTATSILNDMWESNAGMACGQDAKK